MIFSNGVTQNFKFLLVSFLLLQALNISKAVADQFDTFNVAVGSAYSYESNLFRLPSNLQPTAAGAERSDNILRNTIGFSLNKKYSLQAFKLNFEHADTRYDSASFLDFKANNYNASWLWALTPQLTGTLSTERTVSLVPFQDIRVLDSTSTSTLRNFRTTNVDRFSADFSPYDKWHLIGSVFKIESTNSQDNSQVFLPENSFTLNSLEGGVRYEFASQSTFSLVSRTSNGENSVFNPNPQFAVGRGFEEKQQELTSIWVLTGKSTLVSNIGHTRRTDDTFTIRDFSGLFGGLNYTWAVTGKTSLNMGASRTISSFSASTASFSVNNKIFVNPIWYATSKIAVRPRLELSKISYEGVGPLTGPKRDDENFTYGIGMEWRPRSTITLGLNLQHTERNSTLDSLDYSANTASINGQLTF